MSIDDDTRLVVSATTATGSHLVILLNPADAAAAVAAGWLRPDQVAVSPPLPARDHTQPAVPNRADRRRRGRS